MKNSNTQSNQGQKKIEPLTEDLIAEIREVFSLFDKDADGLVDVNDLGSLLRANYMNPSNEEVDQLKKEIDPNNTGKFDQNDYIKIVARRGKDNDTLDELIEAIRTVCGPESKNEPSINAQTFRYKITSEGEKMESSEVEEILKMLDLVYKDTIKINELASLIMKH